MPIVVTSKGTMSAKDDTGDAPTANSPALGLTAGDTLIVCVMTSWNPATVTYYRNAGTANPVNVPLVVAGGAYGQLRIYKLDNVSPLAGTDWVQVVGDNYEIAVTIYKASGLSTFDKSSTGNGSSNAPTSGLTATTSVANELVVGAVGYYTNDVEEESPGEMSGSYNGTCINNTQGTSRTRNYTGGNDEARVQLTQIFSAVKIVSTPGQYNMSMSWSQAGEWGAAVITIRATPPPLKTVAGLAQASVKTMDGLAFGSVKTLGGLSNQ